MNLTRLNDKADLMLAAAVVGILMLMIIPIPARLLDMLLAFNITLSLVILLVAMYNLRALEFSAFPSLLLIATLFCLALNSASTRLILLHGSEGTAAAGHMIKAFGQFVVGGDFVVGMILFAVLIIINFVVITKGAGRIAQVAARFTLDAMPGKQMSIDADLNAGLINETEARQRRKNVEGEAEFYGAMDGASKFVRGDAVAGILITAINIVGGFIIGILRQGMPLPGCRRDLYAPHRGRRPGDANSRPDHLHRGGHYGDARCLRNQHGPRAVLTIIGPPPRHGVGLCHPFRLRDYPRSPHPAVPVTLRPDGGHCLRRITGQGSLFCSRGRYSCAA